MIDHRAPGAGQLVEVETDGKFIFCVGLQISHQNALLIPEDYMKKAETGRHIQDIQHIMCFNEDSSSKSRRVDLMRFGDFRGVGHSNDTN